MSNNNNTPRALREYRALAASDRQAYDPSGKRGADDVRRLQHIARAVAALRDARHQARTNQQYPAYQLRIAQDGLRAIASRGEALPRDAARHYLTLPLGPHDAAAASAAAHAQHPRRKNWLVPGPSLTAQPRGACIEHVIEYRGRHKGRTGANWEPTMRALARISLDGAIMTALIGWATGSAENQQAAYTLQAGRGYQWQVDDNGVRLVRRADGADYHPTTDDVRAGRATIIAALRERAATRKAAAKAARRDTTAIKRASRDGVWVCLADSLAAGNCRAGTEAFARRHGLGLHRHYRVEALPAPASETESRRVALAVLAAQRRQAREMIAGVCAV